MAVRNSHLAVALAALAAGVSAGAPSAAAAPPGELAFGGRLGLVFATVAGEDVDASSTELKGGPSASLLARWRYGAWSAEVELGVSDRGTTYQVPAAGGETIDRALHLYYVDLPVVGAYQLELGRLRPRLQGGLMFSLLAGSADRGPDGDLEVLLDRRLDVALVLGVGVELPAGDGTVLLDLRYLGGGRPLAEDERGEAMQIRNQAVALSAAFAY